MKQKDIMVMNRKFRDWRLNEDALDEVAPSVQRIKTEYGEVRLVVEEDAAGMFVDIFIAGHEAVQIDFLESTGEIKVKQKVKRIKIKK